MPPRRRRRLPWALVAGLGLGLAACAPVAWHTPGVVLLPWRLVAGLLLAEAVVLRRVRRLPRRRVRQVALLLLAGAAATFALREALAPMAFFHQNGQGPFWAQAALCGGRFSYGAGYREVFGWVPSLLGGPTERTLFLAQALAAATLPVSGWVLLRALRVRPALAWTAFAALAAAPSLARAGQSESYYATCAVLLFAAAAVLAVGASGRRRLDLWLGIGAAGLLVAQAARVHPVCWLAAAALPAVLAVGRGSWRRRLTRTLLAGVGIGVVVAVTTGPGLLAVIHGELGRHWLKKPPGPRPFSLDWLRSLWDRIQPTLGLAAALALVSRGADRVIRPLVLATIVAVMLAADLIGDVIPAVAAAHLALWLPVPLAVLGVTLSSLARRRAATSALVATLGVLILAADVRLAPAMLRLPTDVLEARAVAAWRATLPPKAHVVYLSNAGQRVVNLPIYGCGAGGARPVKVRFEDPLPAAMHLPANAWYVRDSLCDTAEGRAPCQRIEAAIRAAGDRLVEKRRLVLPGRESMIGLGYPSPTVSVTLFQVQPSSPAAAGSRE